MKILVTGGAGFIGSNVAKAIKSRFPTWSIYVLDNLSSSSFKNLIGFEGEVIAGDINDRELWDYLKNNHRFDVIFHKAAITDTTVMDQKLMLDVNTNSFRYILDAALSWRSKVIYASSAGVYGNTEPPMKEDQGLQPENIYGFSKLCMDYIAMNFIREHPYIHVIGLRYFNVYGPGESYKGKTASMIYQLYNQIKSGNRPRLFKWGEQKRDFVYIKDVIKANLLALEKNVSGIFNVGSGRARSFNEIVSILNSLLGTSLEVEYFDCPYEFYQNYTEADLTNIKNALNFEPDYTLEEGIKDYVNFLENGIRRD